MTVPPTWSPTPGTRRGLTLPAPPGDPVRASFPVLATVAPVLASVAIWALTQSPFALLFALLGPVIAVASIGESTWQQRRRRRREQARFEAESIEVQREILERHTAERAELETDHPLLHDLLDGTGADEPWPSDPVARVRIGTGDAPSALQVERSDSRSDDAGTRSRLDALEESASRLPDSAVVVDARKGIAFCGPPVAVIAAARACVIRLAQLLDPGTFTIRTTLSDRSRPAWTWLSALPHRIQPRTQEPGTGERIEFVAESAGFPATGEVPVLLVVLARRRDELPRRCETVLVIDAAVATLSSRRGSPMLLRPEFASGDQALAAATALTARARRSGLLIDGEDLVEQVALSSLANAPAATPLGEPPPGAAATGLACEVGAATAGAWTLDLVADGPHAAVGGVTGSGKSELLTSWLLAMATRYTPEEVNFLLVDFKGGATFGTIALLPHSVGLITDLDRVQARRALESLRAELTFRERTLAAAGVRSISELAPPASLPRLVIVVDEFQALSGDFPELRELFSDLAARGRSLGIHLILCTQRPAATLRDAILANCTLRICLRVNDPADSIALIGTGAAAELPRTPVGRAFVSTGGDRPGLVQVAIATLDDAAAVARAEMPRHPVRRPWRDPLPALIDLRELTRSAADGPGIPFGMLDLPESQRQSVAVWDPRSSGNLLVLGGFGSGKSVALAAIEAGPASTVVIPAEVEGAWDRLRDVADSLGGSGSDSPVRLVLIDDVDALIARFDGDYQPELIDALHRLLRDGPAGGTFTVLSARSVTSALQRAASACDSRLVLRMPDRSEHVVAGGRGVDFDERMPPGGGFFAGHRVQVGWSQVPSSPSASPVPELPFAPAGVTAAVSGAPREFAAAIRAGTAPGLLRIVEVAGSAGAAALGDGSPGGRQLAVSGPTEHLVFIGDPDAWQAAWAYLPAIRSGARMVFHRCSVSDYRSITRSRRLPPVLSADPGRMWVVVDDEVQRATIPRRIISTRVPGAGGPPG